MENCEESVIIARSNVRTGYNVYCGEDLQDYVPLYVPPPNKTHFLLHCSMYNSATSM